LPSETDHVLKAEHNEFFVSQTDNPFFDWKLTGIFYSALHYVDAYLATMGIHPPSHAIRLGHVRTDPKLTTIRRDYRELLNESRTARYEPPATFDLTDTNRAQHKLDSIKKAILPL
jgi:hypothetical protein